MEAWDEFLTLKIYQSLAAKLAPDALVMGWKPVSLQSGHWKSLGAVPVPASWAGKGTQDVYVLQRTRLGADGEDGDNATDQAAEEEGEDEL